VRLLADEVESPNSHESGYECSFYPNVKCSSVTMRRIVVANKTFLPLSIVMACYTMAIAEEPKTVVPTVIELRATPLSE
jgi:hypothetical protein